MLLVFSTGACASRDEPPDNDNAIADAPCDSAVAVAALPAALDEASGAAFSHVRPGVIWTHNDSGTEPYLYAIDTLGAILHRVAVDEPVDPVNVRDWEDIALAPCDGGHCIFIADIGDNSAVRTVGRIVRLREPDISGVSQPTGSDVRIFPFRYPDGPRDAEALFVLPGERVHIVTKGRSGPVAVYRYPGQLRTDTVTLEHMRDLTPGLVQLPDQVTGAAASDDGRSVLIRTYSYLQRYDIGRDGNLEGSGTRASLASAGEPQGEAVAWRADGAVFLLGEKGFDRESGVLARASCR
ncbi:MAG TPA: hypothetical protein VF035_07795 [Longimicrobiales bacterium]